MRMLIPLALAVMVALLSGCDVLEKGHSYLEGVVGLRGGTLHGPYGTELTIPAGAVDGSCTITMIFADQAPEPGPKGDSASITVFIDMDPCVMLKKPATLVMVADRDCSNCIGVRTSDPAYPWGVLPTRWNENGLVLVEVVDRGYYTVVE